MFKITPANVLHHEVHPSLCLEARIQSKQEQLPPLRQDGKDGLEAPGPKLKHSHRSAGAGSFCRGNDVASSFPTRDTRPHRRPPPR